MGEKKFFAHVRRKFLRPSTEITLFFFIKPYAGGKELLRTVVGNPTPGPEHSPGPTVNPERVGPGNTSAKLASNLRLTLCELCSKHGPHRKNPKRKQVGQKQSPSTLAENQRNSTRTRKTTSCVDPAWSCSAVRLRSPPISTTFFHS